MIKQDFIVVGGGLADLSAAIALAEKEHRVCLYERSSMLGGRAITRCSKGWRMRT